MRETERTLTYKIVYWLNKFKLGEVYIGRDDNTEYMGYITTYKRKPIFYFNLDHVNHRSFRKIEVFIFHELGHIKNKTYLWRKHRKIDSIRSEYLAETFAYENIKKYFPKYSNTLKKEMIKLINDNVWTYQWPIHQEAFKKVYI
jgi:hypothetical protein